MLYVANEKLSCGISEAASLSLDQAARMLETQQGDVVLLMDEWAADRVYDRLSIPARLNYWPVDWSGPLAWAGPGDQLLVVGGDVCQLHTVVRQIPISRVL